MTKKVLISMHEKLASITDLVAERQKRTRSEFVREAIRFYIRTKYPEMPDLQ